MLLLYESDMSIIARWFGQWTGARRLGTSTAKYRSSILSTRMCQYTQIKPLLLNATVTVDTMPRPRNDRQTGSSCKIGLGVGTLMVRSLNVCGQQRAPPCCKHKSNNRKDCRLPVGKMSQGRGVVLASLQSNPSCEAWL